MSATLTWALRHLGEADAIILKLEGELRAACLRVAELEEANRRLRDDVDFLSSEVRLLERRYRSEVPEYD